MFKLLLGILVIGLVILLVIIAVVVGVLKKGTRFLMGSRRRRFSSSDFFRGNHSRKGHHSYGHLHYHKKHSSHSFFSS